MPSLEAEAARIFLEAVEEHEHPQRAEFIRGASAGDSKLLNRVHVLLRAHDESHPMLQPGQLLATVDNPEPSERPGTMIGPYKLLEQIGEGGMGLVFFAVQQHPVRRSVALKLIKPGMDSRQVIARFEAERQALALMDHPNIAKVLDAGTTDAGRPYFVMELVRGIPITEYCDQARLAVRQRLEVFIQVCRAVQHAHTKGVIHRDLKPTNVLVTSHDGIPVPLVIDFGVAKALGQQLTEHTLHTAFAQMVGTPLYMSPEQAEFNQLGVDTRSDIYSLGVLLYELLTGVTPFDQERLRTLSHEEFRRILREEEPPRPSARLSTLEAAALSTASQRRNAEPRKLTQAVHGELDWIVLKSLEKDRTRRYETASAFAADVQRYLNDEAVEACPPSATYRVRKFARRNKTAILIGVCSIIAFSVAAGGIGWIAHDRSSKREATEIVVNRALEESDKWQERSRLPEALSAARRADGLAAGGTADESLRRRVRARVADLELLAQLEDARLEGDAILGTVIETGTTDRRYGQIFRAFHLDIDALSAEEAGKHIRDSTVALELASLLDDWAIRRRYHKPQDVPQWKHLLDVARAADPDEWRTHVRDALAGTDREPMATLAATDHAMQLRPWTLDAVGKHLRRTEAIKQAEALLRKAQRHHPDDFWINLELGMLLRQATPRRSDQALPFLMAAVALRPQSALAHINLGSALNETRDLDGAIAEFRRAIDLDSSMALAHGKLGLALSDQPDLDGAIAAFRRAIELDPKLAIYPYNLGNALRDKGDLDRAIVAFRQAIELNPNLGDAHHNLGNALCRKGDLAGAITEYRTAIKLNSKVAVSHKCLGDALIDKGDVAGAIAAFRQAIKLKPDYASAHHNLGCVLRGQGKFTEALASLRRGYELGSSDPRWPDPSGQLIKDCERLIELDAQLSAILSGIEQPANAKERIEFAKVCQLKQQFASAARLFREAFAARSALAEDLASGDRYNAACAAALAGCGQGKDAAGLEEKERGRLRSQAIDWLKTDLEAWRRALEKDPGNAGSVVVQQLQHWLEDSDFNGVRGVEALAKLPEAERQSWQKLWTNVAETVAKFQGKAAPKKKLDMK